jgi:segregation and condensation protein B
MLPSSACCALPTAVGRTRPADGSAPLSEWRRAWLRRSRERVEEPTVAIDEHVRSPKVARLEAALIVAGTPLSIRKLAQFASLADPKEVRQLIDELNTALEASRSAFRVERLATGYQLLTLPQFAPWLDRLHHRQSYLKLSPPMMETLAIVAYRQPITRADIEVVRGVQCAEMLKQLMERGLVKIVGEDDSLGRPYLYGTTRQFLELYGLRGLDDLPMSDTLRPQAVPDSAAAEFDSDADADAEASGESEDAAAA